MNNANQARLTKGFYDSTELEAIIAKNNTVLDIHSLLVSTTVSLGSNNTFYPNVVIEQSGDGKVSIGDNNIFYPGVYILSSAGSVNIGNGNEFGTGGCTIKANMDNAEITIGDGGRYCDGVSVMGATDLGSGSQILGNITAQSCTLATGGNHSEPDPDLRAAVLKGFGLARGLTLLKGQVINGSGNFSDAPIEWQHAYHPKKS